MSVHIPQCIICHMEISIGNETYEQCSNSHPIHEDCLKEWLVHSKSCPLCSDPYPPALINKYGNFLAQKEKEKQEEFNQQVREQTEKRVGKIVEKIAFLKKIEIVDNLIEKEQYDNAIERLEALNEEDLTNFKGQTITFLKGKVNYLKGRYDLAISFLFKLVKQKYDFPNAFLYLGKSYQELGLIDKAKWAFDRAK